MNVLEALANLPHKDGAGLLREDKVVVEDALKELAAVDAAKRPKKGKSSQKLNS